MVFKVFRRGGVGEDSRIQIKIKTVDETIASDTVYSNDSELNGFVLEANTEYAIIGSVPIVTDVTPDFKHQITFPIGVEEAADLAGAGFSAETTTIDWQDQVVTVPVADNILQLYGSVSTGITAGVADYQWAQRISSVLTTTVRRGSWIMVIRQ